MTVRDYSQRGDQVGVYYLGYTILVGHHKVTIHAPDGHHLVGPVRWSMAGARAFIRGHRNGD